MLTLLRSTTFLLFALFILGQLLSILAKASFAVRSTTNPLNSRREYLYLFWDLLLYRGALVLVLFWALVSYPTVFNKIAQMIGLTWDLSLPLVPPLAFFAGLLADVALEFLFNKVPRLRIDLPPLPDKANAVPAAGV